MKRTYQASKTRRARTHGFLVRMKSRGGRAVTRSLLKRQIYAAGGRHAISLARGLWIVRLRAPFDRTRFVSAASPALREVARAELEDLFLAVSRPRAS